MLSKLDSCSNSTEASIPPFSTPTCHIQPVDNGFMYFALSRIRSCWLCIYTVVLKVHQLFHATAFVLAVAGRILLGGWSGGTDSGLGQSTSTMHDAQNRDFLEDIAKPTSSDATVPDVSITEMMQ